MLVGLFVERPLDGAGACSRSASGAVALFLGVVDARADARPAARARARLAGRAVRRRGRASSRAATRCAIPTRTASTASALMIGLALVTLVGGARGRAADPLRGRGQPGVRRQLRAHRDRQLHPDQRRVASTRCSASRASWSVSGVRAGDGRAFGSRINVTGVEPNVSQVISRSTGSTAARRRRPSSAATARSSSNDYANAHHLARRLAAVASRRRRARGLHLTVRGNHLVRPRAARRSAT